MEKDAGGDVAGGRGGRERGLEEKGKEEGEEEEEEEEEEDDIYSDSDGDLTNADEAFIVKSIIKHKPPRAKRGDATVYLVEWERSSKGEDYDNTWEPVINLKHSPDVVDEQPWSW